MIRAVALCVLLVALAVQAGEAGIVEIALPQLEGLYSNSALFKRVATVVLPSRPTVVHSVSIRLSGTSTPGTICCGYPGSTSCVPGGLGLIAVMPADYPSVYARIESPGVEGAFEWTAAFAPLGELTWDFLLNGETSLALDPGTIGTEFCRWTSNPAVTVTGATIIVDADFPVPTRSSSWGRIKALYR